MGHYSVQGCTYLEGEQEEEGHHKTKQSHGLGESESKDSVGEQLLLEAGVPSVSNYQASEHRSNSSSRSCDSDCSCSSSDKLGSGVDIRLGSRGGQTLSGLNSSRPHATNCSHGEARRDSETGNGRHGYRRRSGLL